MKYTETRSLRRSGKEIFVAIPKAFAGMLGLKDVKKVVMFMETWENEVDGKSQPCIVMIPVGEEEGEK
jgi:hypothetical protein